MRFARALLLILLLAGAAAAEESLDDRWQAVRKEAIVRLHAIAKKYASAKLYGTRNEVLEVVLTLDPDDETARQWLRYKKTPEGWVRPPTYKPPRNRRPPRPDLDTCRADWRQWFGGAAADLAIEAGSARRFDLRRAIIEEAVPLAPDHALLRMANGEVRTKKGCPFPWVLKETWSALKRRPALRDVASRAIASPPRCTKGRTSADEPLDGIEATAVLQGEHVRVLGAVEKTELQSHFARLEATWPVFRTALGIDPPSWTSDMDDAVGLSVYVFPDMASGQAWLEALPDVTPEWLAFAKELAAVLIPGRTAMQVKSLEGGLRLEAAVRLVLDSMVITELGIKGDQAWISEGLNHYLSWPINRTRLIGTAGIDTSPYAPGTEGPKTPLPTTLPSDDWLAAGADLLKGEDKPNFYLMVGKNLGHLTANEILYGYCIAAYLLEGRPSACVPFLKAVGGAKEVDVEPKLIEHLGFDVKGLEHRLTRWLEETTALSRAER